jgi:hypothetical protein
MHAVASVFGTELPFPVTENIADAEFLFGGNRPQTVIQHRQKRRPKPPLWLVGRNQKHQLSTS